MSIKQSRFLGWLYALVSSGAFGLLIWHKVELWIPYVVLLIFFVYSIKLIAKPSKAGESADNVLNTLIKKIGKK